MDSWRSGVERVLCVMSPSPPPLAGSASQQDSVHSLLPRRPAED